jgi:hypothetical protein
MDRGIREITFTSRAWVTARPASAAIFCTAEALSLSANQCAAKSLRRSRALGLVRTFDVYGVDVEDLEASSERGVFEDLVAVLVLA